MSWLWLAAASLLARVAAAQCALCGESLSAGGQAGDGDPALGFHWGVCFLLGSVFTLIAGLVGFVVYVARSEAASPETPRA
jgi:hypothetical protein